MALGTLAAAALPSLVSAGASWGLGKLFGGNEKPAAAPIQQFRPTGITAGGLTSSVSGDNLTITPSAERLGLVRNLAGGFTNEADALAGLRDRVTPGFSDLRTSRLQQIEDARKAAIGNLRENMARRRVLGSSFGQDALTRAELEFGRAKESTAAESFLQELDATNQLVQQEFQARRGAFEAGLNDLNLQADVATKLAAGASAQLGANARLEAELAAKEAAGKGKFFGENVISPISKAVGSVFSGGFGGGGGGSTFQGNPWGASGIASVPRAGLDF